MGVARSYSFLRFLSLDYVFLVTAPVTGNIARRYGSRICVVIGGVLLVIGLLASAFVPNVQLLAVTLGTAGNHLRLATSELARLRTILLKYQAADSIQK